MGFKTMVLSVVGVPQRFPASHRRSRLQMLIMWMRRAESLARLGVMTRLFVVLEVVRAFVVPLFIVKATG